MKPETGYCVCKNGKLLIKVNETAGKDHNVDVSMHCPAGKPVALVHTHNVNPNPSPQDLQTSKDKKITVCIDFKGQGKVRCYKGV